MITKFVWMLPISEQKFERLATVIGEVHGLGPGYVSTTFKALPAHIANDDKYVIGE